MVAPAAPAYLRKVRRERPVAGESFLFMEIKCKPAKRARPEKNKDSN
jgi:hypothetical protein